MSIQDTIRKNLMETEPEFWNELVLSGRTEKVIGLMFNAYETGVDVAAVGASEGEGLEEVLNRTCTAFATAYATFCSHMMRTEGHTVPPEYNSIEGQIKAAQLQAIPAFFKTLVPKLVEVGFKPLDPNRIRVAQEVPQVRKELILP